MQNALNYRFRQAGISAAYKNGMGITVMNPLGGGLIPNNPDIFRYLTEGTDLNVAQANKGLLLNNLCTGCGYCKYCPQEIDIPKFMDAYNEKILGNSAEDRLKWHWGMPAALAAECVQCGQCETLCTQHLPIITRLAEIAQLSR